MTISVAAEERGIRKGDVVRTKTFGLVYRVLRVWRGKAICEPLSQPQWQDHFMFPVAYLERDASAPAAPSSVRVTWLRADWSIWAHARMANDLTACGRAVRGGEPVAHDPGGAACPVCLTALRCSEGQA